MNVIANLAFFPSPGTTHDRHISFFHDGRPGRTIGTTRYNPTARTTEINMAGRTVTISDDEPVSRLEEVLVEGLEHAAAEFYELSK